MMKILFILALFIGLGYSLKAGSTYRYSYSGRVASGIPEIRNQMAGTAIKCSLSVYMVSDHSAIVKFNNVKVGEYNGDVGCNGRAVLPVTYKPIGWGGKHLEEAFSVDFKNEEGNVMEVSPDEELWVTNLKKSVMGQLRIDPLLNPFQSQDVRANKSYSLYENTIYGRCQARYVVKELPREEEQEIRATSSIIAENSNGTLWRVDRSINFDNCTDLVVLKKSHLENIKSALTGHAGTYNYRSSEGTYLLCGEPNNVTLCQSVIQDFSKLHPYGFLTESFQVITNQTLELVSFVNDNLSEKDLPPKRSVKTWMFEVNSPYSRPEEGAKEWINYKHGSDDAPYVVWESLAGINLSQVEVEKLVERVIQNIIDSAVQMHKIPPIHDSDMRPLNAPTGEVLASLRQCSQIMATLSTDRIEDIFTAIRSEKELVELKESLLIDTLAESGSVQAIRVLMRKIKSGYITPSRAMSVFFTLPNNIRDPAVVPEIFDYIKTLDIARNPFLTSTAYVNLAAMTRRVCIHPDLRNNSIPAALFSGKACQTVKTTILPFFEEKLRTAKAPWMVAMITQSVGNLAMPEAFQLVKGVAEGRFEQSIRIRTMGIYNMARRHLPYHMKDEVLQFLNSVSDDRMQHVRLRQAAFLVGMSWNPPYSWWMRKALSTWNEKDINILTLISSSIRSTANAKGHFRAKQASYAFAAESAMRKLPMSWAFSYNNILSTHDHKKQIVSDISTVWITHENRTEEAYLSLNQWYSDLYIHIMEVAISSGEESNMKNPGFVNKMSSLKDKVNNFVKRILGTDKGHAYLKFFNNMNLFLPFDINSGKLNFMERLAVDLIKHLIDGKKDLFVKYSSPVDTSGFMPTALGCPLLYKIAMPMILFKESAHVLNATSAGQYVIDVNANIKLGWKFESRAEIIVPWSSKRVVVGIDNEKVINLPVKGQLELNRLHMAGIGFDFTAKIKTTAFSDFTVVSGHNIPFTIVKSLLPITTIFDSQKSNEWKVIYRNRLQEPIFNYQKYVASENTGIAYTSSWKGDVDTPFKYSVAYNLLRHPGDIPAALASATNLLAWKTQLDIRPAESQAKSLEFAIIFDYIGIGQGSTSTPNKIASSPVVKELLDSPMFKNPANLEVAHNFTRAMQAANTAIHLKTGVAFIGDESKAYILRFEYLWNRFSSLMSKSNYLIKLEKRGKLIAAARDLFFSLDSSCPDFSDLHNLEQMSKDSLKAEYRGFIGFDSPRKRMDLIEFVGTSTVSEQRLAILKEEINNDQCSTAHNGQCLARLSIPAVYDGVDFDVEWEETVPSYFVNVTMMAETAIRGILFPQVSDDSINVINAPSRCNIIGDRKVGHEKWKIFVRCPQKNTLYDDLRLPLIIDGLEPMGKIILSDQWNN